MSAIKRSTTWGIDAVSGPVSSTPANPPNPLTRKSSMLVKPSKSGSPQKSPESLNDGGSSLWLEARSQLPRKVQDELARSSRTNYKSFLQDIVEDVERKKEICLSLQWTVKWRGESIPVNDIIERITSSVNAFMNIGDQIASYDPAHFGLAWPGVKIILNVATSSQQAMSNVLVGTECISTCLSRCAVYELLYLRHSIKLESSGPLRKALVDLYRAILTFLVKAKTYLGHSTAHRIASTMAKGDAFPPLLEDVQRREKVVRLNADNADAEYMRAVGASITEIKSDLRSLLTSLPQPFAAIEIKLDAITHTTNETQRFVGQINSRFEALTEGLSQEKFKDAIQHLSSKDVSERYRSLRDARQNGTTAWLQEVDAVKRIINHSGSSQIVWVQGKPGVGKSVQCALVSQTVKRALSGSAGLLEYYFTNGDAEDDRTCKSLIRSLLAQLCIQTAKVPDEIATQIEDGLSKTRSKELDLADDQVIHAIISMVLKIRTPTIIIDALDECIDPQNAASAISTIVKGCESARLQILLTSREHIRPLRKVFLQNDYVLQFDVDDVRTTLDDQIHRYTASKLKDEKRFGSVAIDLDSELERRILDAVAKSAEGIILCAQLYLLELCKARSKNALLDALAHPVVGLHNLLIQWLRRTQHDLGRIGDLPIRVCRWISTTRRPLTLGELREAVSIEDHHRSWDEDNFSDPELLLDSCAGIVEQDSYGYVKFIHFSIWEFFNRTSPFDPDDWASSFFVRGEKNHAMVAKRLLVYLNFDDFDCGRSSAERELRRKLSRFKLLRYASIQWTWHASRAAGSGEDFWKAFLNMSDRKLENWTEAFYYDRKREVRPRPSSLAFSHAYSGIPVVPKPAFKLIISAVLGIVSLFDSLGLKNESESFQLSLTCSNGMSALHHAVFWGHNRIGLKLIPLLSQANLDIMSVAGWTALNMAIFRKNVPMIKALLAAGASIHLTNGSVPSPLDHAVSQGSVKLAIKLLKCGASVHQHSGEPLESPLHSACFFQDRRMIKLLLDYGASAEDVGADGMTPLHYACLNDNHTIAEVLLSRLSVQKQKKLVNEPTKLATDAEFRARCGHKAELPLGVAAVPQNIKTIKTLLKYGADPLLIDNCGQNALDAALTKSPSITFLEQLLRIKEYRPCLEYPTEKDQIQDYWLAAPSSGTGAYVFLKIGDEIPNGYYDMQASWYQKPSSFHVLFNDKIDRIAAFKLLQKEGVNLKERDKYGGTLLMSACQFGVTSVIEFLLNEGLEVDAQDDFGQSALHMAVSINPENPQCRIAPEDQERTCKILLSHNASIRSLGDGDKADDETAPIYSCSSARIAKLLLDSGSDANLVSKEELAILAEGAASHGHVDVLRFLFNIDPRLVDGTVCEDRETPIIIALLKDQTEALKYLLTLPDINRLDTYGLNLLHAAVDYGKDSATIALLVDAFKEKNMSLDFSTDDGRTALHMSLVHENFDAFRCLLDNGADPLINFPEWFECDSDSEEEDIGEDRDSELSTSPDSARRASNDMEDSGKDREEVTDVVDVDDKSSNEATQSNDENHEEEEEEEGKVDDSDTSSSSAEDEHHPEPFYYTTLHYAAKHNLLPFAQKLLEHPHAKEYLLTDVNEDGYTALHEAVTSNNMDMTALLLAHGADPNAPDTFLQTPLHFASNPPIAALLLAHGADINARNHHDLTPLHLAASDHHNPELFRFLIAEGADLDIGDDEGVTPLPYAMACFERRTERIRCVWDWLRATNLTWCDVWMVQMAGAVPAFAAGVLLARALRES